jgi:hypothetical protein
VLAVLIYGIDFTGAPSRRKPITVARCRLRRQRLSLLALEACPDFRTFESLLRRPGPWLAALDFPFGLPASVVEALGWPPQWEHYVRLVALLGALAFKETLRCYCAVQPPGQKLPRRTTDRLAHALSPLMLYRVPLAGMFFQGAPRLLAADLCVLPCRPTSARRYAVEGYPALVARRWLGRRPYKSEGRAAGEDKRRAARMTLLQALLSPELQACYDVQLQLDLTAFPALVEDPRGDWLDALLCAVQGAWIARHGAWLRLWDRDAGPALAPGTVAEGWIADPALAFSRPDMPLA